MSEVVTLPQAARLLGYSTGRVQRLCDRKGLHCFRLPRPDGSPGRQRRIARAEVERYARERGIVLREEE